MPQGEKNKLTEIQKTEIFDLKGMKSGYKVAKHYNISHTMVYKIWGGQSPRSCQAALRKIVNELNKTRGYPMDNNIFKMWESIYNTATEALEQP